MDFKISEGITLSQIQDLIYYSREDSLIKQTTTDSKRFKDKKTANLWLKNRNVYTLSDEEKLYGILWFGDKEMPDANYPADFNPKKYGITFGIRIYDKARGKGFSQKLYTEGIDLYKQTEDYKKILNKKIWLSTNANNYIAVSLYKKIGFKEITRDLKRGKILMV